MTTNEIAEMTLSPTDIIHITEADGRLLWAGNRKAWTDSGTDRDGRPADYLRELQVRKIWATWDTYAGRAAIVLTL